MLRGKKIVLGVTGGIAAYKTAFLVRLLIKAEAEVKVIFTPSAFDFVSPLTFSTLSKNPVVSEFTQNAKTGEWTNHVAYGAWADLLIIAPLTANTLAKMANGICDNFLLATYLSAKCETIVAPAMDLDMFAHATTKANLEKLKSFGVKILPSPKGELASGLEGEGRMAEPYYIFEKIENYFNSHKTLINKRIVITAGPTHEPIDPVRFIGNRSSGKMGYALAAEALERGALVSLVSGPTTQKLTHKNLKLISVNTAQEMFDATTQHFKDADMGIFAAAVGDYKVKSPSDKKIKKQTEQTLVLTKNPDILAECGSSKKESQLVVGFALETNDGEKYAKDKLIAKNADFIVLNSTQDKGAAFGHDTNKVTLVSRGNNPLSFELMTKQNLAKQLFDIWEKHL